MASADFSKSLQLTLAHEGGYVNNPKDPGGATNFGVTQAVYDAYRRTKGQPVRSVRLISSDEVAEVYTNRYWNLARCNDFPAGVDYATFDYAVNSGVSKAIKDLQRTVNGFANRTTLAPIKVDGVNGDDTIAGVRACCDIDPASFIESFCDRRISFLKSLKNFSTFGKGWLRRVQGDKAGVQDGDSGVVDYAVAMARAGGALTTAHMASSSPEIAAVTPNGATIPPEALPAPIGAKPGEVAGKAFGSQQSLIKTAQGLGAAMAAAGVTGNTVIDAANTAKGKINGSLFGQAALILFVLLMVAGIGLIVFKFLEQRKEKGA